MASVSLVISSSEIFFGLCLQRLETIFTLPETTRLHDQILCSVPVTVQNVNIYLSLWSYSTIHFK